MTAYLYRHFDKEGTLLYVGESLSFSKRTKDHERGSDWFGDITNITIEKFDSKKSALKAEVQAIKKENPKFNIQHNKYSSLGISNYKPLCFTGTFKELIDSKGLTPKEVQKICHVRSLKTVYNWINNDSAKTVYREIVKNY